MIANLFLSHRMGSLVDRLVQFLEEHPVPPLTIRTILTPSPQIRQWLFLEIAKRKNIAMGLKFMEIEQLFPRTASSLEMFCRIFKELPKQNNSDLQRYLDNKPQRLLELTSQLSSLFFSYGKCEKKLFEEPPVGWQQEILHKLFVHGELKLPIQIEEAPQEPIICFGIDFLPPVYWEFLFKAPSLSVFLFSPCAEFWEDLCSDRERKNLNRYWKKRGASILVREELDSYLRKAPKNLANWGKQGRETLRLFDRFNLQTEEIYPDLSPTSALKTIQHDLLSYQQTEKIKADGSIKVFLTGSSIWKEVECLREQILNLDIPFHEISVLAPDIEPYIPLIEFVFAGHIPYRISGFDIASQSLFRQGLISLLKLAQSRWSVEEVLKLLENPAFYRKQNWDERNLEQLREWIDFAKIQWGADESHRKTVLAASLGEKSYEDTGSWEKGIDRWLDTFIYLLPIQIAADPLEEFVALLESLRKNPFRGEKSLPEWADCLEKAAQEYFFVDENDEADSAAFRSFCNVIREFRDFQEDLSFPLSVVLHLLNRPCSGQINSSQLHAVRIGSLQEEAMIPAKAVFLIGMDEESFPCRKMGSSLDLLKGKAPDLAERDRYCFLQAIFSAQEVLRISYCHLSAEEGKPVGPSLVVQELLDSLSEGATFVYQAQEAPPPPKKLHWPRFCLPQLPKGELLISISDLRALARHPWKFYLQKACGIFLDAPLEDSFSLQKGRLLKQFLEEPFEQNQITADLPRGPLGQALKESVVLEAARLKKQIKEWGLEMFSLSLQENCREKRLEKSRLIAPPIELELEELTVRIVGEIKFCSSSGLVCLKDDLGSLLKAWPEALIAAIVTGSSQIRALKTGKIKELSDPLQNLKAFIEYYFCALHSPSPLLADWADSLLRKGVGDFEKKAAKGFSIEDPVAEWVMDRSELLPPSQIYADWSPYLKTIFSSLSALYPTRGKSHAEV